MRRLSAFDAGFLALETDSAPLHIGALLLIDGPAPDPDLIRAELVRRAASVPACRCSVRRSRLGLRRPVWVEDPGFSPADHVRRASLEEPRDRAALRRLVGGLMSVRLDTARPLWEVWLIDALRDGTWAVLVKAHHTLTDGVAGADLLGALLSTGQTAALGDPDVVEPRVRTSREHRLRRLRQGLRTVAVPDLPPNPLNGPLGHDRTWDWITVDLDDLSTVADRSACRVNDVYLAVLTGALRTLLTGTAALDADTRVRTLVPVSMRNAGARTVVGNLDAAFFVDLPVHLESPTEVLEVVARQSAAAKATEVPLATEQLLHAGDLLPAPLLDRAARAYVRHGQARVNLVASNVRGPAALLALCGRPIRDIVPVLPLALDVRVTSALFSYAGRATISMTVDGTVGPDARALTSAVEAALHHLVRGIG